MSEPSNIENREIESRLVDSKEWQAAIESIPQIVDSSRRLIELASKNKGKLDERNWKSVPRNSDWLRQERFNAIDRGAMKGPNGETLKISIGYPDDTSDNPDFLHVYGDGKDGYFDFSFNKHSGEKKPEELGIGYDENQWRIAVSCPQGKDEPLRKLYFYYNSKLDGDRLFFDFEGIELKFDEQGNINLPKDKANIELILHSPYSSMLVYIVPEDREEFMDGVKRADKMRKRELEKEPDFKQQLMKRIGFLPPEDYAQVQQERINSIPAKLNWFEGINTVKARIQETIAAFESTFEA